MAQDLPLCIELYVRGTLEKNLNKSYSYKLIESKTYGKRIAFVQGNGDTSIKFVVKDMHILFPLKRRYGVSFCLFIRPRGLFILL